MNVGELKDKLDLKIFTGSDGLEREIKGCYIGDLLSFVMGRAKKDDVWITVMNNTNVAAVAVLCDAACVLLAEDTEPDAAFKSRAENEGLAILGSSLSAFELAVKISKLI